jgi:hypothetical protein
MNRTLALRLLIDRYFEQMLFDVFDSEDLINTIRENLGFEVRYSESFDSYGLNYCFHFEEDGEQKVIEILIPISVIEEDVDPDTLLLRTFKYGKKR